MIYVLELKDNDGNMQALYLGFRAGVPLAHGVEWDKAYKFFNKSSAAAFLRMLKDMHHHSAFTPYNNFVVMEHAEIGDLPEDQICEWHREEGDGIWTTACGKNFMITPDHGYCDCGKAIKIVGEPEYKKGKADGDSH